MIKKAMFSMGIVAILVINGWILTSGSGSVDIDQFAMVGSIRAGIEINNSSNECTPDVVVNNNPSTIYLNNGSITINITVIDDDEVNRSIGASEPNNGTDIETVTIDLSEFGIISPQAMVYNSIVSSISGYNTSRFEGIWEYTLSIIGFKPSNYTVYFNATDNGNSLGAFKLSNKTESFTIKIGQYNRAPIYVGPKPTLMYILDEDLYNYDPYEIDLTMLFSDADVDNGPFNNTAMDSLTFRFWDGYGWYGGTGTKTFGESFTMQRNGATISIITLPNKFNTSVPINFSAWDSGNEMVEKAGTVTINPVNDAPVMDTADNWINNEVDNITEISLDGLEITTTQGLNVDMIVTASDIDSNILNFALEGYNISNTFLTTTLFESAFMIDPISGNFNFIPTNDWVGTFEVNISVNDGFESDAKVFTFRVYNANDEPKVITVNDVAISNNAGHLRGTAGAKQEEKFILIVEAADLDIDIGIDNTLRFAATSNDITINEDGPFGETKHNFSFTPDNDNAVVGYVLVNITVKDHAGSGVDDWAIINISVENVNDPPRIKHVTPKIEKFKDMGTIKVNEIINVSIVAEDIDGDTLYWTTNVTQATVYRVNSNLGILTFAPLPGDEGWVIVNVTVRDRMIGGLMDWVELKWTVLPDDGEEEPTPIPPIENAPTLWDVTGPDEVMIGDKIVITGQWADEDGDDIYLMSEITFPDGKQTTMGVIYFTSDDIGGDFPIYEYVDIEDDGTFTYIFDTGAYKQIYDAMVKEAPELLDLIGGKITKGTMTFKLVAVDSIFAGAESDEVIHTVELNGDEPPPEPPSNGNGNGDGDMASSMGLFPYDIVILPTIILLIIITLAVALISRKKRKGYSEYEDTQQYYWAEPQTPSEGETYATYDTTYKEQPSTYPEYSEPQQLPEDIPPPPPPPSTQQSYYPPYYDSAPPPSETQPSGKLIGIMSEHPPGHEKCITCEAIIPSYALNCPSCGTPVSRDSPRGEPGGAYDAVPEDYDENVELPEDNEPIEEGKENEDSTKSY
jgi:hypothetical protein